MPLVRVSNGGSSDFLNENEYFIEAGYYGGPSNFGFFSYQDGVAVSYTWQYGGFMLINVKGKSTLHHVKNTVYVTGIAEDRTMTFLANRDTATQNFNITNYDYITVFHNNGNSGYSFTIS